MDVLFGKQVGMGTRSGKKTFVLINRVYKNPIEFNMQLPMISPATLQLVVFKGSWNRSFFRQNHIHRFMQLGHVVSAPRHFLMSRLKFGVKLGMSI